MAKSQLRLGKKQVGTRWYRVAEVSGGGRGRRTINRIPAEAIDEAPNPQQALVAWISEVYDAVGLQKSRDAETQ